MKFIVMAAFLVAASATTAKTSTSSPRMQVLEWWCRQPQYATTDAVCVRRAAEAAAVKAGTPLPELTRDQKNAGALGVKGTPSQRRLAAAKKMQLRVKTFCDVPEHKAAKACEIMASHASARAKSPRVASLAARKKLTASKAAAVKKSALPL